MESQLNAHVLHTFSLSFFRYGTAAVIRPASDTVIRPVPDTVIRRVPDTVIRPTLAEYAGRWQCKLKLAAKTSRIQR